MKPELTKLARNSKPQYLDHYIKHKLSLEIVPEMEPKTQQRRMTPTAAFEKYTVNEKLVQMKLLEQMRGSQSLTQFFAPPSLKTDFAAL